VLALAPTLAALAACWLLGDRARRRPDLLEPALAGATALSLLAAPHLLIHDLVLLAPALVWTVAWASGLPGTERRLVVCGWLLLNLAVLLDWGKGDPGLPGRLVPLVLIAAGVAAARACGVGLRLPRRAAAVASPSPGG
ncbi:MAG TPA: hypothetical protein VGL20_08675, partial [Candidatus Dormibacteraeota bacterium]